MTRSLLFTGFWLGLSVLLTSSCTSATSGDSSRQAGSFTSQGRKIHVEVFRPRSVGRFPAVLVLHGSSGTVIGKGPLVKFCQQLSSQGKVAVLVHYFDRTGTVWSGDKTIHKFWPVWADTIRDAVDYTAALPEVRSESIGLFGYSLGAYLAVSEAASDSRVKAVAELAGGLFDLQKDNISHLPPLLILHGDKDERVSVEQARLLAATARRLGTAHTIKIYPGEGHVFSSEATADASTRALAFFEQQLGSASSTPGHLTNDLTPP